MRRTNRWIADVQIHNSGSSADFLIQNDPRIHIAELLHLVYICSMIVRCGMFDLA